MFDNYFYHERLRKTVAIFGSLFTKIYVIRTDSNNKVMSTVRVPLAYSPRSKFLARLQQVGEFGKDDSVAIKLPRLSFEMTSIAYDSTRQLAKTNTQLRAATVDDSKQRAKIRQSTPYIVTFSLGVYANNQDDALQIVEQILPYFAPQYTVTMKPYKDYPDVKEDIPITLQSVSFINEGEGLQEQRQTVQYVLDFEVKISFTGPISDGEVITKAITEFELNQGTKYSTITTTPTVIPQYDSDYGFTQTYNYEEISSDDG
jgi:hypothetical protein